MAMYMRYENKVQVYCTHYLDDVFFFFPRTGSVYGTEIYYKIKNLHVFVGKMNASFSPIKDRFRMFQANFSGCWYLSSRI